MLRVLASVSEDVRKKRSMKINKVEDRRKRANLEYVRTTTSNVNIGLRSHTAASSERNRIPFPWWLRLVTSLWYSHLRHPHHLPVYSDFAAAFSPIYGVFVESKKERTGLHF